MGGRPVLSIALLSALAMVMAACEVAVTPIEVPEHCPEMPLRGPTAAADVPIAQLIDDFEDGNNAIVAVAGRNGYWTSMNNLSSTMIDAGPSNACAARGGWAGHFSAGGFTSHGASWTGYFSAPSPGIVPYDGGAYSGVSFWAAIGDEKAPFPVELGVSTMDTIGSYEYYGTTVQLTNSWQRFVLPFSSLTQTGTGTRYQMRLEALVAFIIWPAQGDLDIWIDDLRFEM